MDKVYLFRFFRKCLAYDFWGIPSPVDPWRVFLLIMHGLSDASMMLKLNFVTRKFFDF